MNINKLWFVVFASFLLLESVSLLSVQKTDNDDPIAIKVSWNSHDYNLHTIPSLQLVTNPLVSRQFSPVSKQIFANLKQLNVEYARYGVWFP